MISETSINIIRELCEFMTDGGYDCSQWRIGVTAEGGQVFFAGLGIPRDYRWQICRRALNAEEARAIVTGFCNLSCEPCPASRGWEEAAVFVYAYLKSELPKQPGTQKGQVVAGRPPA